ncbi:MAG: HNH endonuclease [Phycisphaerae bacterium]|nr:HNH endonuclease [Phycisphaerae bacterium]
MSEEKIVEVLICEVEEHLSHYRQRYKGLSWRGKVLLLVKMNTSFRKLSKQTNPGAAKVSARDRISLYLLENIGETIKATELAVVSAISEYGRRVRELRVQDGYKILTGSSNDPELGLNLKPNEYLLLDPRPDLTLAHRWHIANRIRKDGEAGSSGRLLRYLLANVGEIVTNEELVYVARAKEFGRRVRELRTEQGYAIATKFTGRPDLKMGEYVLESTERRAPPHDRKIPLDVQKEVYARDNNTCQMDGWTRDKWSKEDPRILELHHIQEHAKKGPNITKNLVVLCSKCHDDVHAGRKRLPPAITR